MIIYLEAVLSEVQSMPATLQGQACRAALAGLHSQDFGVLQEEESFISAWFHIQFKMIGLLQPCWGDLWYAYLSLCKNLHQCHYSPAHQGAAWLVATKTVSRVVIMARSLICFGVTHTNLIGVLMLLLCAHRHTHTYTHIYTVEMTNA